MSEARDTSPIDPKAFKQAENLIDSDPGGSLSKIRVVLEKLLRIIAAYYLGSPTEAKMLGQIIADKEFARHIEPRILSRMKSVKDLANLAAHGDQVYPQDAAKAFSELEEIIEWAQSRLPVIFQTRHKEVERKDILHDIINNWKYPVLPEIVSICFMQDAYGCHLEVTRKIEDPCIDPFEEEPTYSFKTESESLNMFRDHLQKKLFSPDKSIDENLDTFWKVTQAFDVIPIGLDIYTDEICDLLIAEAHPEREEEDSD
ncbi:MAG: DUF4145 domain-containing protein [Opitutales bacterium]|nr:DUF4145 domain-containing protein [Opitutales bacterium]